MLKKRIQDI
jgi:hypothetical protein